MTIRKGSSVSALILALAFSLSAFGQGRRNQQGGLGNTEQPPPSVAPTPETKPELDAFNALQSEQNPATKLMLCDSFLMTYPNSQFVGYVQRFRMISLTQLGRFSDAIAAGEAGLSFETNYMEDLEKRTESKDRKIKVDKNSDEYKAFAAQTEQAKLVYYQLLMNDYQQLNNAEKAVEYGQKALAQDPQNLAALITVSSIMAERPPDDEKAKQDQMKKALDLGKKAEEQVMARINGPAGAQMTDAQKAGLISNVHQTLGLANLHLKKFGDAQKEYLSAIAAKNDDPVSYYRLGLALTQDKKIDQGMEALAKSVYLKGVSEKEARDALTQLWKASNKPEAELEAFIQSSGEKIGK